MPDIKGGLRTTISGVGSKYPSRTPGTRVGLSLNTFGLQKLHEGVTGQALADILLEAIQPAFDQAKADWPVLTGASTDTMSIEVIEVGARNARVAIQIGGEALINDPRNVSKKDYAPYVEFNGTVKTPPGTLTHAMIMNEDAMKEIIKARTAAFLAELLSR